jgi:hypothetical protein
MLLIEARLRSVSGLHRANCSREKGAGAEMHTEPICVCWAAAEYAADCRESGAQSENQVYSSNATFLLKSLLLSGEINSQSYSLKRAASGTFLF